MEAFSVLHENLPLSPQSRWIELPSKQQRSERWFSNTRDNPWPAESHQPTFPLHNEIFLGGCSANAACRWIPGPHSASEVWWSLCWHTQPAHLIKSSVLWQQCPSCWCQRQWKKPWHSESYWWRESSRCQERFKNRGKKKRKKKKETIASINFWWQFFVFSN